MAGSSAEQEIRVAVVDRLRELLSPDTRIIHELNVAGQGSHRIDVAAVTKNQIIGFEIKSEKDKLDRLDHQWESFNLCCHHVVVVAHAKHFVEYKSEGERVDIPARLRLNHDIGRKVEDCQNSIWHYPVERELALMYEYQRRDHWYLDQHHILNKLPPNPAAMLEMLWRDELDIECCVHRIAVGSRKLRFQMIRDMALMMTGREVALAVCRQLRQREFVQADDPIVEVAA